ncbi:hybrid sensor histidine kinase/response regulator [Tamilnaduibacter salinus]|uniref:Sensory/regulatory protein RpfC n=1 Tax=Tamilnaduibacter salinus TaxID=1484056 RepID=A0A2A2I6S8_9GAMM|nr:ATP-binding protein [Tamilnaduibacter salinus]PAV26743.1 hybrid sensor histidine kinase/response regulator [Tamilnaduibacter salinus]
MERPFKTRLSFRLTRNTVLLALLLGILLNLVQVGLDYTQARAAMDDEITALINISDSPASQIAYNIDARLARELLDGLLNHPAILQARISDPEGDILAEVSRATLSSDYRWLSDALFGARQRYQEDLSVPQLDDMPLGELSVTIDTYHYGTAFLNRAGYTLISGFVKSLILSIILLFIFHRILTRPILNVISALGRVEPDAPEKTRLPVPPSHNDDEIGRLVTMINHHLDTIDESLKQVRMAEARMKDYSFQLEREVDDRTREISEKNEALKRGNRALIRAKEEAMQRARGRADFLANMSHEIRTPLNGVLGMLSLTLDDELTATQRDRLELARSASESLLGLLNDILDISKVEAGKLGLEAIDFNLVRVVREAAALMEQQADRKGIGLTVAIAPGTPEWFVGDPTRIRQVVNNLLSNAVKFTDHGEVRIMLDRVGDQVRIDVLDTGIGLSVEARKRIFSPFSQGSEETTRRYGGTGLGLTLCRQLVDRMNGRITVDSEPGEGTRFTVWLPLSVSDTPDGNANAVATLPEPERPAAGRRILLVEDNRVNQVVASGMLKKLGHQVEVAENGEKALEALDHTSFDLVLMDCQMPVMDGYQAARAIRRDGRWPDLPLIAVTANVMEGDAQHCIDAGMDDYMSKPYDRDTLQRVVQRWT